MTDPHLRRTLGLNDVILFNIIVIFSLRGMATAAKMGPLSILLWLVAVGAFLVPLGLAVAEMATRDPGEGGLYRWSRAAFGDLHGFLCGWFYWVSNITYLPTLLVFLAGNAVYVFARPDLGEAPRFVLPLTLVVLWGTAWLNVRGWTVGKIVTNLGATASWMAAVLLVLAGAAAFRHAGSATVWSWGAVGDGLLDFRSLGYFGTLSFALAGLELAPIMGGEIKDPRRVLPRATLISAAVIAILYILGTVAILAAVPPAGVSPISGALGAIQAVADRAGWPWLPSLGAALVSFSVIGGILAWLGGSARLPLAAGLDRFLPDAMARTHPVHGTPAFAIWFQTALCTVLLVASQAGATVREAYLLLLDMTIIQYFLPFLYLFASLPRLRAASDDASVVRIGGGRVGLWLVTVLGIGATAVTLITAVIPPPDVESPWLFEAKLWGGMALFSVVGYGLFVLFTRRRIRALAQ